MQADIRNVRISISQIFIGIAAAVKAQKGRNFSGAQERFLKLYVDRSMGEGVLWNLGNIE